MNKTLIIYAGGTIGMVGSDAGLTPSSKLEASLRQALSEDNSSLEFDFLQLENLIDSSNLQPEHWRLLAEPILGSHRHYSRFVILHGTDTMAYSAAALSYITAGLAKTIIFSGSQIPLSQANNDALDNVKGALKACQSRYIGTALYFGGQLLPANRISKVSSSDFNAFAAANAKPLAPPFEQPIKSAQQTRVGLNFQNQAVALVHFHPGISSAAVASCLSQAGLKLAILLSYGAGNVPAQDPALMATLRSAAEAGVIMVNISQCAHGGVSQGLYEAGDILNQCGVVAGGDMTLEAAFAKAHFLIAQGLSGTALAAQMAENLAGELSGAEL